MHRVAWLFLLCYHVSCTSSRKISSSENVVIQPRSEWNAKPARPYRQHKLERITVHHEGTKLLASDDAAKKIENIQRWGMGSDRNWADIPYHFLIAPDGTIYEGRNVNTVGETATEYDPAGHLLINCLGNLEIQEVPESQLNSLIALLAYVSKKYNISPETIATHRDHSKKTICPGKNLYRYFESGFILDEVKKRLHN